MALKLGKCRLCLKLGDFYSIFTVDNSLQLAEMVMECTKVKVYEGDGLPDKVCSECIQKLSSAFIFKQQCERSDQELRRNYVPPPGFSCTPPPNRQSSDSAFSTHTELSKPSSSSNDIKPSPASRSRKRSGESIDTASLTGYSRENSLKSSKPIRTSTSKRARVEHDNNSMRDSDYEDNSVSHFSMDSEYDESSQPEEEFNCDMCDKRFESKKSLLSHKTWHSRKTNTSQNVISTADLKSSSVISSNDVKSSPNNSYLNSSSEKNALSCDKCGKEFKLMIMLRRHHETCLVTHTITPQKTLNDSVSANVSFQNSYNEDNHYACEKCGSTFKLQIMLKRHYETCNKISPKKELLVSLEPITPINTNIDKRYPCEICPNKYKGIDGLEKHMKICHAAVLKKTVKPVNKKVPVPCVYCGELFEDYYIHYAHFNECPQKVDANTFECKVCQKVISRKQNYLSHIKSIHFEPRVQQDTTSGIDDQSGENFDCRMCNKKLPSQELLVTHLAAHVSNIDEFRSAGGGANSRASTIDDSTSLHSEYSNSTSNGPLKCKFCMKAFTYKKSLESHINKQHSGEFEVKVEPSDSGLNNSKTTSTPNTTLNASRYRDSESDESSQEETDNTCDICEKQFSYKRLLIHHKRTKHNMSSGTKRAKIVVKDCKVKCLICDIEMTVATYKEHNQAHISNNIKPRNLYTCTDCGETFKSLQNLSTHIKMVHRLHKMEPKPCPDLDLADFCEVVVTKAEPLDAIQSYNDFGEVPGKQSDSKPCVDLSGFTCPICNKKMNTLIALKRHVNWHTNVGNNIENKIECFVCKQTFRFKGHYKLHMREHYRDTNLDPKFLICPICNRKSKHLRAAQMHMNFHKQTRFQNQDYKCAICKRVLQNRKVYLSHMAIHYKRGESQTNTIVGDVVPNNVDKKAFDGTNTCMHCGKVCDSENSLKHHLIWHKSKTLLYGSRHECPICHLQFTNKRRQELHLRTHYEDDNGPFKCSICGKGYIVEDYFKRHVKGHNFDHQNHKKRIAKLRENKVKCPICNRYYSDLVKLIRHLRRTHPESKMIKADPDAPPQQIYSCKLCAKIFFDEKRLQSHEEAHLRKPEFFKCKFCGKKTISLKTHNIHIKSHLVKKHLDNPLKCTKCDETFIRGYDLHYHLRDVHQINETWIAERNQQTLNGPLKDLQCAICLKILASKGNYERHIDYHNSLRCNYCFDYFSSIRFLDGHLAFACEKKKLLGETENYPRKIKCHICYKAFHLQVKLDCHLRTQHNIKVSREAGTGKKEIVCDYCFRVFENEDALSSHKLYHRTIGYYGCIYCDRKFNTLTSFRKHKNHHFSLINVDNPHKCEHCDKTFEPFREMIYHMRDEHGDDKEWVVMPKESIEEECNICHKIFFNVQRHLQYHEDNRCKKCGEYFYSHNDFDSHLCSIESDDEPQNNELDLRPRYEECRFCFKPLTKANSKLKHDLIHRGSGSISCRFCPLKFKTIDAFNIHAFSHRSRKYNKKPIKCRQCSEKFIRYGPFIKHMKSVHKSKGKMHYRAIVKPERCVVCGDDFPNLHSHYRAHLQNQCQSCFKYFTSYKVFSLHDCDKEDSDPSKVFVSDENLIHLINTYIPKDAGDEEKYYGMSDDEEELIEGEGEENIDTVEEKFNPVTIDDESQNSEMEHLVPISIQSPVISDVLSLYQANSEKNNENNMEVINLDDEDSVGFDTVLHPVVTIDD